MAQTRSAGKGCLSFMPLVLYSCHSTRFYCCYLLWLRESTSMRDEQKICRTSEKPWFLLIFDLEPIVRKTLSNKTAMFTWYCIILFTNMKVGKPQPQPVWRSLCAVPSCPVAEVLNHAGRLRGLPADLPSLRPRLCA
jgi:hypothetical protein